MKRRSQHEKTFLSLALALAMSLSLAVPAAAAGRFSDVASNAYYAQAVDWAVEQNITTGTSASTFSPDDTCTRAQIITFLWRSKGSPEPDAATKVSDCASSDYFYKAVLWAKEQQMFEGDRFQPNDPCTRLMAVEFIWRANGSSTGASDSRFSDVSSPAVNWAVFIGITTGTSATTFSPNDTCTRGQIVTFLYRAAPKSSGEDNVWDKRCGNYYYDNQAQQCIGKLTVERVGNMITVSLYTRYPNRSYGDRWFLYNRLTGAPIAIGLGSEPFKIEFRDGSVMLTVPSAPYLDGEYVHESLVDVDYEQLVNN